VEISQAVCTVKHSNCVKPAAFSVLIYLYAVHKYILGEGSLIIRGSMSYEFVVRFDHTKYQRDALNIIYSSNILLYMFRVSGTHLQEEQLYVSSIWYRHSL